MNERTHRLTRLSTTGLVLVLAGTLAACGGSGVRTAPAITIATGASGVLTATPGATLDVKLNVTNAEAFNRGIEIIGDRGVGATAIKKLAPFNYALALPRTLKPGAYRLMAVGYAGKGKVLATASATLQVSLPAGALMSLAPPPATLVFEAIGEQLPIRVTGDTSGASIDLSESPGLTYRMSDVTVGTVDAHGMVTASAEGQASVALLMNGRAAASAPIEVLKPALLPSATHLDFGSQKVGGSSTSQVLTVTNNFAYPLRILSVSSPPDYPETDDCVASSPLAAGASCAINIVFRPTAKGNARGAVSIVDGAVVVPTRVYLSGKGS